MKHLPLDTADLDAIDVWIKNGAHLFPYNEAKHPVWRWRDEWIKTPSEAKKLSDDNQWNIAFDIETAGACMIDIDNLLPLRVPEMNLWYAKLLETEPDLKLHRFIDRFKQAKKKEYKRLGIDKCRQYMDAFIAECVKEMPPHNHQPSSSGFGHHLYYRVDIPDGAKTCYQSGNIEIFANPHPAFPVKWSDLQGFFDNEPVPYEDVVEYWRGHNDSLDDCSELRAEIVQNIPPPQINLDSSGRIVNYDYEAYLDRNGYGTDMMNNRLNAWVYRAGQLGDESQLDIAAAEARAYGHAESRIQSTLKSAWNAGIANPAPDLLRQRSMIAGFQNQ